MIPEVKRLNPKPGLKYGSARRSRWCPTCWCVALPDGSWHVELNSETLPRVLVNQTYYASVSNGDQQARRATCSIACRPPTGW